MLIKNSFIKSFDWNLFANAFSFNSIIHYHPLVFISFALEVFLFGLNPFYFHFVNILIHAFSTFLVLVFVRQITGNRVISLFAALLFAVHPLHVESVAWIAERKDLLYSVFYLFSLVIYIRFIKGQKQVYYYLSMLFFVLSCLSKAMAVTLPFVLILIDYILKRNIRKQFTGKIPFLLISLLFIIINLNVAYYNLEVMVFSTYERIILIGYSLLFYPFKMLLPFSQSALYSYPESYSILLYMLPFLCLAVFYLLFRIKDESKILKFGIMFYIVSILPVLPILPFGISFIADRFVYLPIVGLFLIVIRSVEILREKYKISLSVPGLAVKYSFPVIIALLAVISFNRCYVWKDTYTLMTDVIEKDNENFHAYYMLGSYYYEKNDFIKAVSSYNNAARLRPDFACTYYNLGNVYLKSQKYYDAIENYNKALKLNPVDKEALNNLGLAYELLGDCENAVNYYSVSAGLGYKPAAEVVAQLKK